MSADNNNEALGNRIRRESRHDNHDSDEIMNSNAQFLIMDSDSAYGVEGESPGSTQPQQLGQNPEIGVDQNPQARQQIQNQSTRSYFLSEDGDRLDCDARQDSVSEVERSRQSPLSAQVQLQQQQQQSQQIQYYQLSQLRTSMPSTRRNSNSVDLYRFSSAPVENNIGDVRGKTVTRRDSASDLNTLLDDARSISLQNDTLLAARQLLAGESNEGVVGGLVGGSGSTSMGGLVAVDQQGAELGVASEPELVAEAAALGLGPLDQISESGRIILDTMDSPRTTGVGSPTNYMPGEQESGESSRDFLNAFDSPRNCPPAIGSSSSMSQFRPMRSYDSDEQYQDL